MSMNSTDMSLNTTATPPPPQTVAAVHLMSVKEEEVVAMTPEKKAQFSNAHVWDQIVKSIEKPQPVPRQGFIFVQHLRGF